MHSSERLKGIDVFVAVADLGSFTAAAGRLSLTSSAVSKSIARLEARMGVRLFERTTRRLSLSEAGVVFYRTCTSVLADLEEVEHTLATTGNEPHGRVRIDLPASYGRLHVLPLILAFTRQHPLLQPHVSFSDRFVDPVQEGIDIVVRIGGPDTWPAALGHQYFGAQRLMFCAAPTTSTPTVRRKARRTWSTTTAWAMGTPTVWSARGSSKGASLARWSVARYSRASP